MALWAIFLNALRLLLRRKIPAGLILLVAAGIPLSSYFFFKADGTLVGVLRMMLSYSYYLGGAVLMLLTLYLSAVVLDTELSEDQMTLLTSKPAPRWKIMLGKWLAVGAITGGALLVFTLALIYAMQERCGTEQVIAIRKSNPSLHNLTPQERLADAAAQQQEAARSILTAREPHAPRLPSIEEEMRQIIEQNLASGVPEDKLPSRDEITVALRRFRRKKSYPIPPGTGKEYIFTNLPKADGLLTVRYTLNGTSEEGQLGWLRARWIFVGPEGVQPYVHETDSRTKATREFEIPADVLAPDGSLRVVLLNISQPDEGRAPAVLEVPIDTGINILVPKGSFAANCLRGGLLLWLRLLMLAAIGIAATTFLSGSVTAFLLFALLLGGALNNYVYGSVMPGANAYLISEPDITVYQHAQVLLLRLLPDFSQSSPHAALSGGVEISAGRLLELAAGDLLLRGGLAFVVGIYAFGRREIGIPRIFR